MAAGARRRVEPYGDHPDQVVELWLPAVASQQPPVVVLLHGGFWLAPYTRDLMDPLAADLAGRGHPVANVEYRRVGADGGWPATFQDVAAAIDHLVRVPEIAGMPVVTVGHSAGGHLAVWAAGRHRLPPGAPGAGPALRPRAAVSQAGVLDLIAAATAELGDGAVVGLLGGRPEEVPDRYALVDPLRLPPLGVPMLLVHGHRDRAVPLDQSRRFADTASAAGDPVDLVVVEGGHFVHLDPAGSAWAAVRERLQSLCG